jgi:NADH-quinone oxidoreductase subunit M
MLWLVKRVVYGPVSNKNVEKLTDLDGREFLVLGTLACAVFLMGLWPGPLLHLMGATVHHLVDQAVATKIPLVHAAATT